MIKSVVQQLEEDIFLVHFKKKLKCLGQRELADYLVEFTTELVHIQYGKRYFIQIGLAGHFVRVSLN